MTTDITTGIATGGPVEPDSTLVQQLDPNTLIMNANVRRDAGPGPRRRDTPRD